ncbi:MAG: hypothetical protein KatS3mg031_2944 [Chitinophagales bacterium]|nr:MAG: hypothetical protein KatS3mg031_2944 [Chitinophagales bacterium]
MDNVVEIKLFGIQLEDGNFKFKGHITFGEKLNERVTFHIEREGALHLIKTVIEACALTHYNESMLNNMEKKALECAETFCNVRLKPI